jgi:hypothetical protein
MVGRVKLILILLLLQSIFVSVDNSNATTLAQSQGDWDIDIGEKLRCISTHSWDEYEGYIDEYTAYRHSKVTVNGWPPLSAESHPFVGTLESWSDIPNPNATFWLRDGENISSIHDLVFGYDSDYDYAWQGQGEYWFDYILPNRSPSVYEGLLVTLTQGPWNHSISPEYFQNDPSYWGYHYSLSHEGFLYNVTVTYWIQAGHDISDNYAGVIRNGWIKVYNESTRWEVHMRQIKCSPSGPAIGGQIFYHSGEIVGAGDAGEYIQGETDNKIFWEPLFWPTGFAGSYGIYLNGTVVVPEQTHMMSPHWSTLDATSLNYSVDGLSPGVYNFTLIVKDITGNIDTSTFMLTVLPSYTVEKTMFVSGIGIITIIGAGLAIFNNRKDRILD